MAQLAQPTRHANGCANPAFNRVSSRTMTTVAIYLRSATDTEDSAVVQRQREACLLLCLERGWLDTAEYCDAADPARVSYKRMSQDIASGQIDRVVTWHMDRIARSPRDLEQFIALADEHNVQVATAGDGGCLDFKESGASMLMRLQASVGGLEAFRRKRGDR